MLLLQIATDGSVLYNDPLQKINSVKVYDYLCEKYVHIKYKLGWLG